MSQVAPNGQIRFLKNVPLDKNYENSIDFLTELEQRTYFLSLNPVHTQANATYIRDGVIRVDATRDKILPCNYICFQNTNFSNKWFYAFIVEVRHLNNNTCEVEYQIDDIQAWMFDTTLGMCFVEREHTATDRLFEHTVDEGFNVSEYVTNDVVQNTYKSLTALLFVSGRPIQDPETEEWSIEPLDCRIYQGNMNGLGVLSYNVRDTTGTWNDTELQNLSDMVKIYTTAQQKDALVALIVYPTELIRVDSGTSQGARYPIENANIDIDTLYGSGTLNGHTVVNKKLYNSPYCLVEFGTSDGQKGILQPEFLHSTPKSFIKIMTNISPTPSMMIVPYYYQNVTMGNWEKAITFDAFPQCAMAIDGYAAWVASGGLANLHLSIVGNAVSGITGGVSSALSNNPVGFGSAVANSWIGIEKNLVEMDVAKTLPPELKGSINPQTLTAYSEISVFAKKRTIKKDVAESIDSFFTMYGYKVNKLKQPSRRNRPHFTYLKTKGCHADGGAPADAIERIEAIYDKGVRFWVNPSEVGDFTVNNAPV